MARILRRAAACVAGLVALASCSAAPATLSEQLSSIEVEAGGAEVFSASLLLDGDGWYELSLGLVGKEGPGIYSRRQAGSVRHLSLPQAERLPLQLASISEERARGILDEIECDGLKYWDVKPTLTDATIEQGGCASKEPSATLLAGQPISTPSALDAAGVTALWRDAATALGSDVVAQVLIGGDGETFYVLKLMGGCRSGGGVLYARDLAPGGSDPIRIECVDTAAHLREHPGLGVGGVTLDDVLACLPKLNDGGLNVKAGGCVG